MKKTIIYLTLAGFGLFIFSSVALAVEYPLPGLGANPTISGYIHALFVWGLGIVGGLSVAMLAYGGFRYMIGQVEEGKDIITSAIIGLLLLFGTWLILYTINPNLATLKEPKLDSPQGSSIPYTSVPTGTPTPTAGLNEQNARNQLAGLGIGVKTDCPQGQWRDCVDMEGVKQPVIDELGSLASQVGASNVYVTAGTEGCGSGGPHTGGSGGHCGGNKVDLRPNPTLDNYITTNYTNIGVRSDGAQQYRAPDGTIYAYETSGGPHWDVLRP